MAFQAKLITKLEQYSVGDAIIELNSNVDKEQLNNIVKAFLKQSESHDDSSLGKITFDFIIGNRLLQTSVDKHLSIYSDDLKADEILSEKLVEVEFLLSLKAPEPLEAIPHEDWVSCVDANETHIISGSYDNTIRIFDLKNRKNVVTIRDAHEKPVTRVKWLKNRSTCNELYFVSSGHDEVSILRRFNTKTNKTEIVYVYRGHNRSVNCIDSCDDMIASGSFDKTLRIWSAGKHDQEDEVDQGIEPDSIGDADSKKKNKKLKVKSNEKSVRGNTRSAIMTLTGHQESVTGVKWLGSCNEYNSVATCSMDRSICIWDVEVGECKRRVLSAKPLLGIDFCGEKNLILSASCDRHIRAWDARAPDNATAKTAYTSHNAWISSVALGTSSSNNFISGGYDNLVKLWDLRSPKACMYDMIGHHDKVLDVNWSNPGYVLSGSADATLKVFVTK